MQKKCHWHYLFFLLLLLNGCATIVAGKYQKIKFTTEPSGALISVYDNRDGSIVRDSNGMAIKDFETPVSLRLERGTGQYGTGAMYDVVIRRDGYEDVTVKMRPSVSDWFIVGNIFTAFLGWLVIDPLTGAMWELSPNRIDLVLKSKSGSSLEPGESGIVLRVGYSR